MSDRTCITCDKPMPSFEQGEECHFCKTCKKCPDCRKRMNCQSGVWYCPNCNPLRYKITVQQGKAQEEVSIIPEVGFMKTFMGEIEARVRGFGGIQVAIITLWHERYNEKKERQWEKQYEVRTQNRFYERRHK